MINSEIYSVVMPKYARIYFTINNTGKLVIHCAPSFTPGQLPEGVSEGQKPPKGSKFFDYTKTVIFTLEPEDVFKIVDMFKKKNAADSVTLFRNTNAFSKTLKFEWKINMDKGTIGYSVLKINSNDRIKNENIEFNIPLKVEVFGNIVKVLQSYSNMYVGIKQNIIDLENNNIKTLSDKLNVLNKKINQINNKLDSLIKENANT